ncbi:MAG: acyltransferase [Nocardioides sp.]|nr:acyltransferase [Nocardioides sp.]
MEGRTHTYESYRHRRYFSELDGLRAISVLLVFTTHIDALFWDRLHGNTGVTFFFVLSGFLITTLCLREESRDGRLDLGSFYLRRVFRIYPLYVAVLALYSVLILGLGMASDRRAAFLDSLPYYLGFLPEQALLASTGVEPPFSGAWSLGIEEKFYFVWPLLGFVVLAARFRPRVVTLLVLVAAFACAPVFGTLGHLLTPYALIAMGCVVGLLLHDERWYGRLALLGEPRVFGAVLALVVVIQVTVPQIQLAGALYVAYGVPVTALLVGLVVTRSAVPARLSSRPLVFLGRISYAFYLTHNFAINAAQAALPQTGVAQGLVAPAIALVLAIAFAWLLHVTIEKPLIKLGHRLAHRRKELRGVPAV